MKLTKRLISLALCAALTLTPALAFGVDDMFPFLHDCPGYSDVSPLHWFSENVRICYETGLMEGMGDGTFDPNGTLTVAQAATVAARMHDIVNGGVGFFPPTTPWWEGKVSYLLDVADRQGSDQAALLLETVPQDPASPITRAEFILLLSLVVTDEIMTPINGVDSIPDTKDPDVLRFYQAGILNGIDRYGYFAGDQTLKRSECAAMISRIARTDLRKHFFLENPASFLAAEVTPETVFFSNGLSAERYLDKVDELIFRLEDACLAHGLTFNWYNNYGDLSFMDYVRQTALEELGVTESMGTTAYKNFDVRTYYARYIELTTEYKE